MLDREISLSDEKKINKRDSHSVVWALSTSTDFQRTHSHIHYKQVYIYTQTDRSLYAYIITTEPEFTGRS